MKNKEIILTPNETDALCRALSAAIYRARENERKYGGGYWKEQEQIFQQLQQKILKVRG